MTKYQKKQKRKKERNFMANLRQPGDAGGSEKTAQGVQVQALLVF